MSDANASPAETAAMLRRFTGRLIAETGYMAGAMAHYQKAEQIDDDALAQQLGTTAEKLTRLAMCKRPDPNSARFADEVRQIAIFTRSDASVLARLLRQVHALGTFAEMPEPATRADATARASRFGSGVLAAARDQADATESQDDSAPPDELSDASSDGEARP